jgi:aspartate/methionine/tyrosine aminotransferase
MKLSPFLLGNWLSAHDFADPPIRYNLAGSTGPRWKFGELLDLGGKPLRDELEQIAVAYAPSEGTKRLRQQIAKWHGVDAEAVVVTSGASEAISMLMCVASEPGASVVLPSPGYPATEVMAEGFGLKVRHYALTAESSFNQDAATVLEAVDATTRLVFVNSPHNPTGSVMPPDEQRKLAQALDERSIPLVVDEVFHPLYHGKAQPTAAGGANMLVIGDMSKALSLPGLRIGWVIDRDEAHRRQLIEARGYFSLSGPPMIEAVAAAALESSDRILARVRSVTQANLVHLEKFIDSFNTKLKWVKPEGGTLSFPWLASGEDTRPLCEAWAKAGVLVAPGDCFGEPRHMRLGFGSAEPQDFAQALERIAHVLKER